MKVLVEGRVRLTFSTIPALLCAIVLAVIGIGLLHLGVVDLSGFDSGVCSVMGGIVTLAALLLATPSVE